MWGRIEVTGGPGSLRYRIHEPYDEEQLLRAGDVGIVLPEVEHEVEPIGELSFHVAFLRGAAEPGDG